MIFSKARYIKEFIIAALLELVHIYSFSYSVTKCYVTDTPLNTGVMKVAKTDKAPSHGILVNIPRVPEL